MAFFASEGECRRSCLRSCAILVGRPLSCQFSERVTCHHSENVLTFHIRARCSTDTSIDNIAPRSMFDDGRSLRVVRPPQHEGKPFRRKRCPRTFWSTTADYACVEWIDDGFCSFHWTYVHRRCSYRSTGAGSTPGPRKNSNDIVLAVLVDRVLTCASFARQADRTDFFSMF